MIAPVSNAAQSTIQVQAAAARQTPVSAQPQAGPTDTVQLSGIKAVLQEVSETSAQTTKEAFGGDIQAMRLLVKEAANQAK